MYLVKNSIRLVSKIFLIILIPFLFVSLFLWLKTDAVTLIGEEKAIATAVERVGICKQLSQESICVNTVFVDIAKNNTMLFTIQVMERLQQNAELQSCHFISHLVGNVELSKNPGEWRELLKSTNPYRCGGGFLHGILERLLAAENQRKIDPKLLREICDNASPQDDGLNCIHTMGHLLVLETGRDLEKSIEICKRFVPGVDGRSYQCYHGLFMEYTTKLNFRLHNLEKIPEAITQNDVDYLEGICRELKNIAAKGCWEQISRYYLTVSQEDSDEAYLLCARAGARQYVEYCRLYLGSLIVSNPKVKNKDIKNTINGYCKNYDKNSESGAVCRLHLVGILLSDTLIKVPTMIKYCSTLDPIYQDSCFLKIGSMLYLSSTQEKIDEYCMNVPQNFKKNCKMEDIFNG